MLKDQFQRPMRDLRISVTDRCNFRCSYCMPVETFPPDYAFLPRTEVLSFEEITRLARIFARHGVVKIRLTGGEPLVRSDLPVLVRQLKEVPGIEDLALTTNGTLLPERAAALREAGLDRLTISLDSLDDATFRQMNGDTYGVDAVLAGIDAAATAGFQPLKFNAVVQRGVNEKDLLDLAEFARQREATMRFIEYMDVGTMNQWKLDEVVPAHEILRTLTRKYQLEPIKAGYRGEVALRFRYRDGKGEVGVIASVTQPFCGDCTRVRITPDGKLYTCLFGTQGTDLRKMLREGAQEGEIDRIIRYAWQGREDRYSELRTRQTPGAKKVEMFQIGG